MYNTNNQPYYRPAYGQPVYQQPQQPWAQMPQQQMWQPQAQPEPMPPQEPPQAAPVNVPAADNQDIVRALDRLCDILEAMRNDRKEEVKRVWTSDR